MKTVYDDFWTVFENREYADELAKLSLQLTESIEELAQGQKYYQLCKFAIVGVLQYLRRYHKYTPDRISICTFKEFLRMKEREIDFVLDIPVSLLQLISPCVSRIQHSTCVVRREITSDVSEHFVLYTVAAYRTLQNQFECSLQINE